MEALVVLVLVGLLVWLVARSFVRGMARAEEVVGRREAIADLRWWERYDKRHPFETMHLVDFCKMRCEVTIDTLDHPEDETRRSSFAIRRLGPGTWEWRHEAESLEKAIAEEKETLRDPEAPEQAKANALWRIGELQADDWCAMPTEWVASLEVAYQRYIAHV